MSKKVAVKSKAESTNPKDLFGIKKVSFTKVPAVALAHCASSMMDGADKYGPYNWRDKPVVASIYVDAAIRHFLDWFEGQTYAKDSKCHHLGHGMACGAILLDAETTGNLVDDRPVCGDPDLLDRVLDQLSDQIAERRERYAEDKRKKMLAEKRSKVSNARRGKKPRLTAARCKDTK